MEEEDQEIERMLNSYQDNPPTGGEAVETLMQKLDNFLLRDEERQGGPTWHWFCDKARPVVAGAATFLLRFHAYEAPQSTLWKERAAKIIHSCYGCATGYEDAKKRSRSTYLSTFPPKNLDQFFAEVDEWEARVLLSAYEAGGYTPDGESDGRSIDEASPHLLHHLLSNVNLQKNPDIARLVGRFPPRSRVADLPPEPAPGLLLLFFHSDAELRGWAQMQTKDREAADLQVFKTRFLEVIRIIVPRFEKTGGDDPNLTAVERVDPWNIVFGSSHVTLWAGLWNLLQLLPPEAINDGLLHTEVADFVHLIARHLHDREANFPHVLRCLVHLLTQIGPEFWSADSPEFPEVVYDSIKDNPAFETLLEEQGSSTKEPWFLTLFQVILSSIWNLPVFDRVLAKVINFMGEELQHERFDPPCRALVMQVVLSTMTFVHRKTPQGNDPKRLAAIRAVFAIQANNIASVAFAKQYSPSVWTAAREEARELLRVVFEADMNDIQAAVVKVCDIRSCLTGKPTDPKKGRALLNSASVYINTSIWEAVYSVAAKGGPDSTVFLIHAVAPIAHIDFLDTSNAFDGRKYLPEDYPVRRQFRTLVDEVNSTLTATRAEFGPLLATFAQSVSVEVVHGLLGKAAFVKHLIILILSHLEDVSLAAQAVVGQISGASERSECFRFLLLNSPLASLNGMTTYIKTFNDCAPVYPEACSIARWMVRCLADVIDILCARDGLLTQPVFSGNPDFRQKFDDLWRLMCKASALIFKHTPKWALFYESQVMTDWMRDAVIFVREMLSSFRIFEFAINGGMNQDYSGESSPAKLSVIGSKMVGRLDEVLIDLVGWLRLTDAELLHQSTHLLCSVLARYAKLHVEPPQSAIATIEKYTTGVKSQGKLTTDQLAELSAAISPFLDIQEMSVPDGSAEDDEIQFISKTISIPSPRDSSVSLRQPPAKQGSSKLVADVKQRHLEAFQNIQPPTVKGFKKSGDDKLAFRPKLVSAASVREKSGIKPQAKKPQPQAGGAKPAGMIAQMRRDFAKGRPAISAPAQGRFHLKNEGGRPVNVKQDSASTTESSDDGSASEEETGLAAISKLQKSPIKVPKEARKAADPLQRRQIKVLAPAATVRSPVLERAQHREMAIRNKNRLNPDLGPFTRRVLLWDYTYDGPAPPVVDDLTERLQLIHPPSFFDSAEDYKRAFEPLLMYECWQQVLKSKEEPVQDTVVCEIVNRHNVDCWLDLDVVLNTDGARFNWYLVDTDVLFLQQDGGKKSILAKAHSYKNGMRGHPPQATLRCCIPNGDPRGVRDALQLKTKWRAHKVFSFSTIYREYAALQALPYYDLFQDIIRPQPALLPTVGAPEIQKAMAAYQVNEPQAVAILGSLQTKGFALIQGPPGTGKTKTICGLVGCWLSSRRSAVQAGRPNRPGEEKQLKPKILMCAPSNAAIDEVAKRLIEGVRNQDGQLIKPKVVRVGAEASVNAAVKDVYLDELVERRMNSQPTLTRSVDPSNDVTALRKEIDLVDAQRQSKDKELAEVRDNAARVQELEREKRALNSQRMALSQRLNSARDKQKDMSRNVDAAKRTFQKEVLSEADVICCTLSGAGHQILSAYDFETVIIDEAAQSVELSSLIPLKYRCKTCILVGDPQQLPPTVLSQVAEEHGYSRSLFVRIMDQKPDAVHLLSIQYRMHPEISVLSSTLFYNSKLLDGPNMAEKTLQPWHTNSMFRSYRFFNVVDGAESKAAVGHSIVNRMEANIALALYDRLRLEFTEVNFDFRIGIVTMYREQMQLLKRVFREKHGDLILSTIDFNTVDGFQGQEKDIIILSCVRSDAALGTIGFLADRRRTNVAITRAKSSLFILGNASTLERSDPVWKYIVQDARSRSVLTKCDVSTLRMQTILSPVKSTARHKQSTSNNVPALPVKLLTPKEIVKANRSAAQGRVSTSASVPRAESSTKRIDLHEVMEAAGPVAIGDTRKRKNSSEGDKLTPPALRHAEESRSYIAEEGQILPEKPAAVLQSHARPPTAVAREARKRKNSSEGPSLPAPPLRTPLSWDRPPAHISEPLRASAQSIPIPEAGPSKSIKPQMAAPTRPAPAPAPVEAPMSTTMFIPKKKRLPPNIPPLSGPSNAKQRILDQHKRSAP